MGEFIFFKSINPSLDRLLEWRINTFLVLVLFFIFLSSPVFSAETPKQNHLVIGSAILQEIEPNFTGSPIFLNADENFKETNKRKLLEAIDHLEKGLEVNPGNANGLYLLGKAHSFAHDLDIPNAWQKSTEALEKCIDLDPVNIQAHFYLAKNYMDAQRFEDAYQLYRTAYTIDPNSEAQKFMAISLMYQRKTVEAVAAMKSYVAAHPGDQDAQKMLQALEEGRFSMEVSTATSPASADKMDKN